MSILCLYNGATGSLEGSDDPGRMLTELQITPLRLEPPPTARLGIRDLNSNWSLIVWTFMIGLLMLMPLIIATLLGDNQTPSDEPMLEAPQCDLVSTDQATSSGGAGILAPPPQDVPPMTSNSSGTPLFNSPADLRFQNEARSPEAMPTWMYDRCLRRCSNCTSRERATLYQQRMAVLRDVMSACRSGDPELRYAASEMTRRIQDMSDDESSTHSVPVFDLHHSMDGAERAFEVGSQIATALSTASGSPTGAERLHVNAVAD